LLDAREHTDDGRLLSRRSLIAGGAGLVVSSGGFGGLATQIARARLRPHRRASASAALSAEERAALAVLGRSSMRQPNTLPFPNLPAGTDTLPGIEHIVVLMLENHSYDNFLGMLGRGRGQTPRGDGFTLGPDAKPTATNPRSDGRIQRAFRMPNTCQLPSQPGQEWADSHESFNNGTMDGFVTSPIYPSSPTRNGPVAMGYWDERDLPFTYALATVFPLADRWFSSALAQTDPQRRFLIAGTALGMTDDIGTGPGNAVPDATLAPPPPNGTIFSRLSTANISWVNYVESYPTGATPNLFPVPDSALEELNMKPIAEFFNDAANGTLPGFSLLDPDYGTQAQENPQNIVVGEAFLERVVRALGASPNWSKTMFILTWDEHGGYYDHVPPPVALAPDAVPPAVQPGESTYDGYARYGFRVPGIVVSAYAKRNHVSSIVYDHTSVLATVEHKWNLAAMTLRDANANHLFDTIDLDALARGAPTFSALPSLPPSGQTPATLACSRSGAGTIPPPESIGPAPTASADIPNSAGGEVRLVLRFYGRRRHPRGLSVEVYTEVGTLNGLILELRQGARLIAETHLPQVTSARKHTMLRALRGGLPPAGRYTLIVRRGRRTLLRRRVTVG
jgi:phospholipase C